MFGQGCGFPFGLTNVTLCQSLLKYGQWLWWFMVIYEEYWPSENIEADHRLTFVAAVICLWFVKHVVKRKKTLGFFALWQTMRGFRTLIFVWFELGCICNYICSKCDKICLHDSTSCNQHRDNSASWEMRKHPSFPSHVHQFLQEILSLRESLVLDVKVFDVVKISGTMWGSAGRLACWTVSHAVHQPLGNDQWQYFE